MSARTFPCKGCGASLEFDPSAHSLKCSHCKLEEQIPHTQQEIREYDLSAYLAQPKRFGVSVKGRDVACKSCGAVVHVAAETLSGSCPFCSTPYTLDAAGVDGEVITPEALLPFKVSRDRAQQLFREWVSSLWFAPSALQRMAQLEKLQGVYRPFWTFDAATANHFSGERGDYYYVTEEYTNTEDGKTVYKTRQVRKIRWTWVSGEFRKFFDDVLVPAGKDLEWGTAYQLRALERYEEDFLAGFVAERYSLPPDQGWLRAKEIIDDDLRGEARSKIGGDEQQRVTVETAYFNKAFKHILLPLYVAGYIYGSKAYRFQINGQTGEVRGSRPYSIMKILLLILILVVLAAVAVVSLLASGLQMR